MTVVTAKPITETVTITQSYRYELAPTVEQANLLRSHIGGTRFVYNALLGLVQENWDAVRTRKEAGEEVLKEDYLGTGQFDLQRIWYQRRDELAPWWADNNSSTYNYACLNLSRAFTNWRAGRARFPTRKSRRNRGSVSLMSSAVRLADSHHVRISRVGEIKTYESTRKLYRHVERGTGRIKAATVSRVGDKFFIAFTLEVQRAIPATRAPEMIIGIDVGLNTLYTGATPGGEHVLNVENPRNYRKSEQKLARAQRVTSRREGPGPGKSPSKRWQRANARVQKIHADVANARKNLLHETTTYLTKNYDLIMVEDLNVAGMLKNHSLAKHISDAAWGEFVRQLEYKSKWCGSTVVKVDRFYPSTKTCSQCGTAKAKLSLDERTYHCEACRLTIDRDLNAAINLARWTSTSTSAGTNSVAGRGGEVRPRRRNIADEAHPDEALTETPIPIGA